MAQNRVRIVDVADSLGLSTATVSKVIHGKTEKISDETVKRVQLELERSGYIPNMAGILLARNNSRIIGVVVNDHVKYEGRVLVRHQRDSSVCFHVEYGRSDSDGILRSGLREAQKSDEDIVCCV